jgi:C-terminal processing protease CtpA/Prc
MPIPARSFEYFQHDANWTRELKNYSHAILPSPQGQTRLKITGVKEGTMLNKLGIEDGDVIELIDGQVVEFNQQSALKYRSMYRDALERMRRGEAVTITISRKGEPVNLIFGLGR